MKALFVGALLLASSAGAYELPEVIQNMENAEKAFQTIGFDFHQAVQFTQMNSSATVEGKALFSRPNKMRIQKTAPDQQVTISNGKTLWVYNPAFHQVWKGSWKSWVGSKAVPEGLVPLGGYMADLKKRFDLSLAFDPTGGIRLVAVPKEADQGYQLELFVSPKSWLPERTIYRSDSAMVVTRLTGVALDPPASADQFQFKAPKGTDVIPLN